MSDMFAIGHLKLGNYLLWITEPVFTKLWKDGIYDVNSHLNLPYYSFSMVEIKDDKHYYVNIVEKFKVYDKYFDFNRPDKKVNDEAELNHYAASKDQQMPLWYLKKSTVQKIINIVVELDKVSQIKNISYTNLHHI